MPQEKGMSRAKLHKRTITGPYTNQRSSPRSLVICPISITTPSGPSYGIVRDISSSGIFFYSNFKPSLEMNLDFNLTLKEKQIAGSGQVVRIEQGAEGAAIGIALKILDSNFNQP